jgi:hypothetical protein
MRRVQRGGVSSRSRSRSSSRRRESIQRLLVTMFQNKYYKRLSKQNIVTTRKETNPGDDL